MHDFVFSTPNTMEIRGRAKEVGISDLGLLKAEGIERGAWRKGGRRRAVGDLGFRIAD